MVGDQVIRVPADFHLCDCCMGAIAAGIVAIAPPAKPGSFLVPITGFAGGRLRIPKRWSPVPNDPSLLRHVLGKSWSFSAYYHAMRNARQANGSKKSIYLHRVVYEHFHGPIPNGLVIDHIDRDGLNNMIENLRAVPQRTNCGNRRRQRNNTSGFTSVFWHKESGKWVAKVHIRGRLTHLGMFTCPEEAARAVNDVYRKHRPGTPVPNPDADQRPTPSRNP